MTDESPDTEDQQPEGESPVAGYNHSYRESIVDRTGELLSAAVETVEGMKRPHIGGIRDPRDGTLAHVVLQPGESPKVLDPAVFDFYRPFPLRRKGMSRATRLDSFVTLTNRFAEEHSAIFACDNPKAPSLTTVFNYHPEQGEAEDGTALHLDHRAHYAFPLSEEWLAWHQSDKQKMDIGEFAVFLEDRIVDVQADTQVTSPEALEYIARVGGKIGTPSDLMTIAKGLSIHEQSQLRDVRRLDSGEIDVAFKTEHAATAGGDQFTIPRLFIIAVPVFARSQDYYRLIGRLGYRKNGPEVRFFYELWRTDLVFERAFEEACEHVAEQTGLPLIYGAPES